MTAHELAKKLLEGPDRPVVAYIIDDKIPDEIQEISNGDYPFIFDDAMGNTANADAIILS